MRDGWMANKNTPRQCGTCHLAFDLTEDMVHCHSREHARFLDGETTMSQSKFMQSRTLSFSTEFLDQGWMNLLRYEGLVGPEFNCPQWLGGKIDYRFDSKAEPWYLPKLWYLREVLLFHALGRCEEDCEWRQYNTGLVSCISNRGRRTF